MPVGAAAAAAAAAAEAEMEVLDALNEERIDSAWALISGGAPWLDARDLVRRDAHTPRTRAPPILLDNGWSNQMANLWVTYNNDALKYDPRVTHVCRECAP